MAMLVVTVVRIYHVSVTAAVALPNWAATLVGTSVVDVETFQELYVNRFLNVSAAFFLVSDRAIMLFKFCNLQRRKL